jgi:hypothetical protein
VSSSVFCYTLIFLSSLQRCLRQQRRVLQVASRAIACQCASSDCLATALLLLVTCTPSVPYSTPALTSTPVTKTNRRCRVPCSTCSPLLLDLTPP